MKKFLTCLALLTSSGFIHAQDVVFHHELTVSIYPGTAQLEVNDTITFPESVDFSDLTFSLHEGFSPKSLTDGVTIEQTVAETDAAVDKLTYAVGMLTDLHAKNPLPSKGARSNEGNEDEGLTADVIVTNRTRDYMAKNNCSFSVAQDMVLRQDPELASEYISFNGTKGDS